MIFSSNIFEVFTELTEFTKIRKEERNVTFGQKGGNSYIGRRKRLDTAASNVFNNSEYILAKLVLKCRFYKIVHRKNLHRAFYH